MTVRTCRRSLRRAIWFESDLPGDLLECMWDDPDRLLARAVVLKDIERCTVVRVDHGTRSFVLKRYNRRRRKGIAGRAAELLSRSHARRNWQNARLLASAGLLTLRPLALIENRWVGVLRTRSYLVTEFIPGVLLQDLGELGAESTGSVAGDPAASAPLRHVADEFLAYWRALGRLRLGHGDLRAENFIIDARGRLWLIDLDHMRRYRTSARFQRARRKDLARFLESLREKPEIADFFRARLSIP